MPAAAPRLIIFDCDGVLVDSEPLAIRVLVNMLARQGVEITLDEAYARFLGRTLSSVVDIVSESFGLALDGRALQAMRAELLGAFRAELKPTPAAAEVVAALSKTTGICVASSSVPERLKLSLDVTGLSPLFGDRVFSATEVENGKPAPDLFLHAAARCGVDPSQCLVIEDSPAGIAAAKAAGMRVFGFAGGSHVDAAGLVEKIREAGPERVLSDLRELPQLIAAGPSEGQGAPSHESCFVAVDVGTASVRAGVVTRQGELLARCERPITVWRERAVIGEYASSEIWAACVSAVREAVETARAAPESIAGIGFDATCSLVLLDASGTSLPLSDGGGVPRDTIAWFDHRALDEAREITTAGHRVLDYSGRSLSPEMQLPKLLWLKRYRPDLWSRIGHAFDLADFLTWKATGSAARSQSTLGSKWAFLQHEPAPWNAQFFASIGLEDLPGAFGLPKHSQPVGARIGSLSEEAATALGLSTNCAVAAGMVDAHAGGIGVLGEFVGRTNEIERHLGLIAGTSSCVLALSDTPRFINGFWGPYLGVVAPDIWLNEGGQSATGALLDHLIRWHSAGGEPSAAGHDNIIRRIGELRAEQGADFGAGINVLPDFHGNRSPIADPRAMGVISGLDLDESFDGLCALYWRSCVGIAMGLRQILEILDTHGYGDGTLHLAGGHTHNPLLMELYADATGHTLSTQPETDALLLGTALCAVTAAGVAPNLAAAAAAVDWRRQARAPDSARKLAYDRDYAAYLLLQRQQAELENLR